MRLEQAVRRLHELERSPDGEDIRSIFDADGWMAMCELLQNGRPSSHYLRVYRDRATGLPKKCCNKDSKKPWDRHAKWAWDTISQTTSVPTSIGFYSQSYKTGLTYWGGIDFDSHGDDEIAAPENPVMYREALDAFHRMAQQCDDGMVLFESSGRGYHVLRLLKQQIPISTMYERMEEAAVSCRNVEILPSPRISSYGKALRAPGSWNPAVDRLSRILGLAWGNGASRSSGFWLAGVGVLLPESGFVLSLFFQATGADGEGSRPKNAADSVVRGTVVRNLVQIWNDLREPFTIELPRTRHNQLLKLIGVTSYQYSSEVVMRFAELQYEQKLIATDATKDQHMDEAKASLNGMVSQWIKKCATPRDRIVFNELSTETRQDAFRILHNFAKHAEDQWEEEFFVSHKELAERLQITRPGAASILKAFEGTVFKMTRDCTTTRARRYCWLLNRAE